MAVTSTRRIDIAFSEDLSANLTFIAQNNVDSPGAMWNSLLEIGPNIIPIPTGGNIVRAVTIIPPEDNVSVLTLKGDAEDVGILLHLTDPSSIALAEGVLSFILDVSDDVIVKFIWT